MRLSWSFSVSLLTIIIECSKMFKALYLYQSQKINHMLPGIYTGKQPPNLPKPRCESTHGKSLTPRPEL